MIQITSQMKILLAAEPADFRKGIDGLARLCRLELQSDPMTGAVFVFRNRRATALKILAYDGQGFWLCHKRLSQGRFQWWPRDPQEAGYPLKAHQLLVLIWNGDPSVSKSAPFWRELKPRPGKA